jgi:hypothetical protein
MRARSIREGTTMLKPFLLFNVLFVSHVTLTMHENNGKLTQGIPLPINAGSESKGNEKQALIPKGGTCNCKHDSDRTRFVFGYFGCWALCFGVPEENE